MPLPLNTQIGLVAEGELIFCFFAYFSIAIIVLFELEYTLAHTTYLIFSFIILTLFVGVTILTRHK